SGGGRDRPVLSSVSGMVKNWGACGSMAPPITVDIMIVLLCGKLYRLGWGTTRQWRRPKVPSRATPAPRAAPRFVLGIHRITIGAMPAAQLTGDWCLWMLERRGQSCEEEGFDGRTVP